MQELILKVLNILEILPTIVTVFPTPIVLHQRDKLDGYMLFKKSFMSQLDVIITIL